MFQLDFYNFDKTNTDNDILENFITDFHNKSYRFLDILYDEELLTTTITHASKLKNRFKYFVFLGTGGSSLGAQALCELTHNRFQNKNIYFVDNVDHNTFRDLLHNVNMEQTCFISVSKSGSTAETLCQTLCIINTLQQKKLKINDHLIVITEPKDSSLMRLANNHKLEVFDHDMDIGGRFSVFSIVGLLPAALADVNIKNLQLSAKNYLNKIIAKQVNHVTLGASFAHHFVQKGFNISVMMPYLDKLSMFSKWYVQLWSESIGKNGQGSTPISALGTVDQHSQLQLYRDGPKDKIFTFLLEDSMTKGETIVPSNNTDPDICFFNNRKMGDLLFLEGKATIDSLKKIECPIRVITFDSLNEELLGQLLVHFICETIFMAKYMNVNAFDQPGVEESKILTKQYMIGK